MHDESHHPPEPTSWEKILAIAKEEVLWLLSTMGMITVSLALGRLLSKLTGSGSIDPSMFSSNWNDRVNEELRKREEHDSNTKLD